MSNESIVHSNAFNFMSFMSNAVDPRTGQYTLAIQLPQLPANLLRGPDLPLQLAYNPLNTVDSGYGKGWNINLSQYVPSTRALSLHTGEQFTVNSTAVKPARIDEQKLISFRFFQDDDRNYRVVHRSGLVEHLRVLTSDGVEMALPHRVYAPSGHWIELTYTRPAGSNYECLASIRDARQAHLLQVQYVSTGQFDLHLHPGAGADGKALATYAVHLSNRQVDKVVLPSADQGSWRFTYVNNASTQNMTCLASVATPTGSEETLTYDDVGHQLPAGAPRQRLPRIKTHVLDPGCGQPVIETRYTYSAENFMGGNSSVTWSGDQDNLYKTGAGYLFSSVESLYQDGEVVRKIQRSYDRHHLLTQEVIEQLGETLDYDAPAQPLVQWHITQTDTTYHGDASVGFALQPRYFQMPKWVDKQWRMRGDASRSRTERTETGFDDFGNPTLEVLPSGVRTVSEYYPAEGSGSDCPPDPHGFVRSLKSQVVHPSSQFESTPAAPVLRTLYRYAAFESILPPAEGALCKWVGESWLQVVEQTLAEMSGPVPSTLRNTVYAYHSAPSDLLRHGRVQSQTEVMHADASTETLTTFEYQVQNDEKVLQTVQTLIGFDHDQPIEGQSGEVRHSLKQITLRQSTLIDQPLLNRDDNDVEIAYEYDELRRVVRETVSPNDENFIAWREYGYELVATKGQQARQTDVDVKGVARRASLDGLNRVVRTERHDADAQDPQRTNTFRVTYSAAYDVLGNLIEETEHDWLDQPAPNDRNGPLLPVTLELKRQLRYDGWNQPCAEIGADGVMHVDQTDLIGSAPGTWVSDVAPRRSPRHPREAVAGKTLADDSQTSLEPATEPVAGKALADDRRPLRSLWSQTADGSTKGGKTLQWINAFDQPIEARRVDSKGVRVSRHQYFYDGLGRTTREIDPRQGTVNFAYDAFDRLVDHILADRSVVHRDYARHSSEDLPTWIGVEGRVLGVQRFDGLGRMFESVTGGRRRSLHYLPGQRQPSWVITPSDARIDYRYEPRLGEEPLERRISSSTLNYEYDNKNARLTHCKDGGVNVLERTYFSTGALKSETRAVREEGSAVYTDYTMHYRTSLLNRELSYIDVLGNTQFYEYDQQGRLSSTTLGTTRAQFTYDALGRTESYVTTDGDQRLGTFLRYDDFDREIERRFELPDEVQVLLQSYDGSDALTERHLTTGDGETLRLESYYYDKRGRLEEYECEGELAPVDPYGKTLNAQAFYFDALDNITRVDTWFPGASGKEERNTADYLFDNEDPVQLSGITNSHDDYPASIELLYDADGNLVVDQDQRALTYNELGQLQRVELADGTQAEYGYDPLDRLANQAQSARATGEDKQPV